MDTQKISKHMRVFLSRVKKKYNPKQIIIFGSYARGDAHSGSDIDVAVISNDFASQSLYDRYSELYDLSNDLNEPSVQAFGFTPQEVQNPGSLTTLKKALSEGVVWNQTV